MSENRIGMLIGTTLLAVFWVLPMVIYGVLAWS